MLRSTTSVLLLVCTTGCIGTETGNPVKPMIDASRIELVMHSDSYEVVGRAGAVSEDGEIASFEVWSSEEPLRSPVKPSTGFAFEFFGSTPPFRVYAENEAGQSEMLALGTENTAETFSCFSYVGEFDFELGVIPATEGDIELLTLRFLNMCGTEATLENVRLRLQQDGLSIRGPAGPTPATEAAVVTIVANASVTEFADIVLVGDRNVGSISFRGRVQR